jgi:hypothetical protein
VCPLIETDNIDDALHRLEIPRLQRCYEQGKMVSLC